MGASASTAAEPRPDTGREFYELRSYRLAAGASSAPLEGYLEKAFIPEMNRRGVATVGVFTGTPSPAAPVVWVLIPFTSPESFVNATTGIHTTPAVLAAGADYLQVPRSAAAFERMDSWLLLAFAGMPRMELPAYSRARQPRLFELRTYESYSELKARKKVDMFNDGEIQVMRDVDLAPVFYGEALTGPNLPHLTYMTSATDAEAHKLHWDAFRVHPEWVKMRSDPQYADTMSKNISHMLIPTSYSQI